MIKKFIFIVFVSAIIILADETETSRHQNEHRRHHHFSIPHHREVDKWISKTKETIWKPFATTIGKGFNIMRRKFGNKRFHDRFKKSGEHYRRDFRKRMREFRRWLETNGKKDFSPFEPAVDVTETPTEYIFVVEIPGVKKENVKIDIKSSTKDILVISGNKENTEMPKKPELKHIRGSGSADHLYKENSSIKNRLSERKFGKFVREFVLDEKVLKEKISAKYENGVLIIQIPKAPAVKETSTTIKIH